MARKIEDALEELDQMIEELEDRETSLEDSFQIYQEGIRLLKFCNEKIDTVEKKMMQMNEDGTLHEF